MNDDQLYYFLVDKNTRNVMQIDYPSDIDEFNKILGTSEGKGELLKDLGIILNNHTKVFTNPVLVAKPDNSKKHLELLESKIAEKPKRHKATKKNSETEVSVQKECKSGDLFAGLFD